MPEEKKPKYIAADAVESLAMRLYDKMDRLDPVECPAWPDLDEENREFYRACVLDLLAEKTLVQAALDWPATTT